MQRKNVVTIIDDSILIKVHGICPKWMDNLQGSLAYSRFIIPMIPPTDWTGVLQDSKKYGISRRRAPAPQLYRELLYELSLNTPSMWDDLDCRKLRGYRGNRTDCIIQALTFATSHPVPMWAEDASSSCGLIYSEATFWKTNSCRCNRCNSISFANSSS